MKKISSIKNGLLALLCVAAGTAFTACDADPVEASRGNLPDKETLENTYIMIRSVQSPVSRSFVGLTEGTSTATDKIYCRLTQPAETAVSMTAAPDESLVEAFNEANETAFQAMPAANVLVAGNGALTVAAGKRASEKIEVSFKADGLAAGEYLLPITISSGETSFTEKNRVLYYLVKVRNIDPGKYDLNTEFLTVFYVNTSVYQPLLAGNWLLYKRRYADFSLVWEHVLGNIINLRIVQIGQDKHTGRAMLVLNPDIRYVLEHVDKYVRPLQDQGRKVCLCIEGNGSGVGFCNLSDGQIADFVAQVKSCIELYGLDGVNLFDRNSGYGEEGAPAMNTTSYPKLIKAMREALGTNRLITLSDYEEPTETFWDMKATGGIEPGKYLDYAWSGYMSSQEGIQLLDPWKTIDPTNQQAMDWGLTYPTSKYTRKPIAGLSPQQYGHFALPLYTRDEIGNYFSSFINIGIWSNLGWAPNNIFVVTDLISREQGEYEGEQYTTFSNVLYYYTPGSLTWNMEYLYGSEELVTIGAYGYLRKDW